MKVRVRPAVLMLGLAVLGAAARGADRAPAADAGRDLAGFTVTSIAEGVRCISDEGEVNAYLIEGSRKALLVDSGYGRHDLDRCVAKLTKLPVEVLLTHGHRDHAGGVGPFGRAYAHEADWKLVGSSLREGVRVRLFAIADGDRLDLGGRVLQVIGTPGHTPGSVCVLDAAHRLLFAGDTTNRIVWLFLKESLPLETYLASLRKLNARAKEFDTVLPGHGAPLDAAFIGEQIACAEQILSGGYTRKEYRWRERRALQWTCQRATIAFDPEKLRAKP